MKLHSEWVRYGDDKQYSGLLLKPANVEGPLPVVLVIQEIWGVDEHIEDVAGRFAAAGYVAFAPDLYAQGGERIAALSKPRVEEVKSFLDTLPTSAWQNPEERTAAMERLPDGPRERIQGTFGTLFGGLNLDSYTAALAATTSYLREDCEHTKGQGIATVGFCMGGALSVLLSTKDAQLRGAVIFYGRAPSTELLSTIACPVRGFYGGLDKGITDAVPAFAAAMQTAGKDFAYTVYEGAHHAFFNDTRKSYHVVAARDAFAQSLQFFRSVLA